MYVSFLEHSCVCVCAIPLLQEQSCVCVFVCVCVCVSFLSSESIPASLLQEHSCVCVCVCVFMCVCHSPLGSIRVVCVIPRVFLRSPLGSIRVVFPSGAIRVLVGLRPSESIHVCQGSEVAVILGVFIYVSGMEHSCMCHS